MHNPILVHASNDDDMSETHCVHGLIDRGAALPLDEFISYTGVYGQCLSNNELSEWEDVFEDDLPDGQVEPCQECLRTVGRGSTAVAISALQELYLPPLRD
jgi:hypothetical protein